MWKQIVEVGSYPCQWFIDGESYAGTVELRASGSPRGEIFDYAAPMVDNGWSPELHQRDQVVGQLRDNNKIVMLDAKINQWWMDRASIVARSAICGLELDVADLRFDEIEFQVGGLTELAGVAPIERTEFPPGDDESPRRFGMTWRNESEQEWTSGQDRINLSFHYKARLFDMYQFSVTTFPVVTLTGPPKTLAEWRELYIDPLRGITSLSKASEQEFCWLTLGREATEEHPGKPGEQINRTVRSQLFEANLTQEPYLAERGDPTRNSFISLSHPSSSLATYIENWRSGVSRQQTFFELLMASMRVNLSDRARFLTVAPALESFHSILLEDAQAIVHHKERRSDVLSRIEPIIAQDDYRWLKKNVDTRGTPSLERRLRELFDQLPNDIHDQILANIAPIPANLHSIKPSASNAWQCVAHLRNNLAHGGPTHSRTEIRSALRLTMTLMIALALQTLDAPTHNFTQYIEGALWLST